MQIEEYFNFLSDNDIRKLTKALKLKNPTEAIIKYCVGSAPKKALLAKRKTDKLAS